MQISLTALLIGFLPFLPLSFLLFSFIFFSPRLNILILYLFFFLLIYTILLFILSFWWTIFYFNAPDASFYSFLSSTFLLSTPFFPFYFHLLQYSFFILFFPIATLQRTRTRLHRHADCQSAVLPLLCTFPLSLCNIHTHYLPCPWLLSSSMKENVWVYKITHYFHSWHNSLTNIMCTLSLPTLPWCQRTLLIMCQHTVIHSAECPWHTCHMKFVFVIVLSFLD